MKISDSNVSFLSSHHKYEEIKERESLEQWSRDEDTPLRFQQGDRLELSSKFKNLNISANINKSDSETDDEHLPPELMIVVMALEALTGKKLDVSLFRENQSVGWGIDYQYEKTEIKEESLKFSAQGSVETQDGRSMDFSLALSMKNHSKSKESISIKACDALLDPLVLNFGTDTVKISNIKHNFDLDLDGKSEEFSFVANGSGFLALDKNKDGKINDGRELFGPTHGNGFDELSKYDNDANNWIDENDDIFEELLKQESL